MTRRRPRAPRLPQPLVWVGHVVTWASGVIVPEAPEAEYHLFEIGLEWGVEMADEAVEALTDEAGLKKDEAEKDRPEEAYRSNLPTIWPPFRVKVSKIPCLASPSERIALRVD